MQKILIPIDIDAVSWSHFLAHCGAGSCRDANFVWFDLTREEFMQCTLVLSKRDNLDWFPAFYAEFQQLVPDTKGIDIFRFVTSVQEYIGPGSMEDKVVF